MPRPLYCVGFSKNVASLSLPVGKGGRTAGEVPVALDVFGGKSGSCREESQEGLRMQRVRAPHSTKRLAS